MFEAWLFVITMQGTPVSIKHPEPLATIDECKTHASVYYIKTLSTGPVRYIQPVCIPVVELPEVDHSNADTVG